MPSDFECWDSAKACARSSRPIQKNWQLYLRNFLSFKKRVETLGQSAATFWDWAWSPLQHPEAPLVVVTFKMEDGNKCTAILILCDHSHPSPAKFGEHLNLSWQISYRLRPANIWQTPACNPIPHCKSDAETAFCSFPSGPARSPSGLHPQAPSWAYHAPQVFLSFTYRNDWVYQHHPLCCLLVRIEPILFGGSLICVIMTQVTGWFQRWFLGKYLRLEAAFQHNYQHHT